MEETEEAIDEALNEDQMEEEIYFWAETIKELTQEEPKVNS